jgi:hypothetical protein
VAVERASATVITYCVTVKDLTSSAVNIEARYAVLNEERAMRVITESDARERVETSPPGAGRTWPHDKLGRRRSVGDAYAGSIRDTSHLD